MLPVVEANLRGRQLYVVFHGTNHGGEMKSARVHVIDSHTGGEPTRVVVSGGPPLGKGSMADRLASFRKNPGTRNLPS